MRLAIAIDAQRFWAEGSSKGVFCSNLPKRVSASQQIALHAHKSSINSSLHINSRIKVDVAFLVHAKQKRSDTFLTSLAGARVKPKLLETPINALMHAGTFNPFATNGIFEYRFEKF